MGTSMVTASTWGGWYRPTKRHAWQRLTQGNDYGQTWNQLLDAVADRPRGGELLLSHLDPNGDQHGPIRSSPRRLAPAPAQLPHGSLG